MAADPRLLRGGSDRRCAERVDPGCGRTPGRRHHLCRRGPRRYGRFAESGRLHSGSGSKRRIGRPGRGMDGRRNLGRRAEVRC